MYPIDWRISQDLVPYGEAVAMMEQRVADMAASHEGELVWCLEHPPLYTTGTGTKVGDVLEDTQIPVFTTGRGGRSTYHGPGQRVVYLMLDLNRRGKDVRQYVQNLESWLIAVLAHFGIQGHLDSGNVGVWVKTPDKVDKKIAALGIRVRRWVTYHGIALNVHPNLSHFEGIIPCGIADKGVTSFHDQGVYVSLGQVDAVLKDTFSAYF